MVTSRPRSEALVVIWRRSTITPRCSVSRTVTTTKDTILKKKVILVIIANLPGMAKGWCFFPFWLWRLRQHRSLQVFQVIVEELHFLLDLFDLFSVFVEYVFSYKVRTLNNIDWKVTLKFYNSFEILCTFEKSTYFFDSYKITKAFNDVNIGGKDIFLDELLMKFLCAIRKLNK